MLVDVSFLSNPSVVLKAPTVAICRVCRTLSAELWKKGFCPNCVATEQELREQRAETESNGGGIF